MVDRTISLYRITCLSDRSQWKSWASRIASRLDLAMAGPFGQCLSTLICRCQTLAGMTLGSDPLTLTTQLCELLDDLPDVRNEIEGVLAQRLAIQTLARLSQHSIVIGARQFPIIVLELSATNTGWEDFKTQWRRSLNSAAFADRNAVTSRAEKVPRQLARQALALVQRHYSNPKLSLGHLARRLNVSPWHLSHVIRHETGATFSGYLHSTRVRAAARLLTTTPQSVKEIAAAVGYATSKQLDRHAKRLLGSTPTTIRARSVKY